MWNNDCFKRITPSTIESSDVENVKLSRKKNFIKLNRNNLIKLLNLITLKLPTDALFEPLHDIKDKATDKLFTAYASMWNDNGKAPAITVSSMIVYIKMSLNAFSGGSRWGYSTIWKNNIKKARS